MAALAEWGLAGGYPVMTAPSDCPQVLALSNRKGGTGKTTTAVNLAAEFGRRGLRTLLVDLDTQGHAACGFGIKPARGTPRAHDALRADGVPLSDTILPTDQPNIWLAPADDRYEEADRVTPARRLAAALAPLRDRFDRIVIDTPPSLGGTLVNALTAADAVLVPLLPHHLAGEGVRQLSRLFFRVAMDHNPDLQLLGIVPVMVDRRLNLHRQVIEAMSRQFGADRIFTGIRSDIQLAEAFAAGQPITAYRPRSRGALDHSLLVDEIASLSSRGADRRPARPLPPPTRTGVPL